MQKADEPDSHAVNRNNEQQVTANAVWTMAREMQQCGEMHALAHAEGEKVGPTTEENAPQRMRRGIKCRDHWGRQCERHQRQPPEHGRQLCAAHCF